MLVYQRVNSTRSTQKKTQWTGNAKGQRFCRKSSMLSYFGEHLANPQAMQSSRLEIIETNWLEYNFLSLVFQNPFQNISWDDILGIWLKNPKLKSPHRFSYLPLASKPYSCSHLHPTSPRVGAWPHGAIITWRIFAASSTNAQLPASRTSQLDQMTNSFP